MARIRYLKPDFFKDEDLAELPFETRLFFAGLWNFADKSGRLEDRPQRLKVEIFPYDKVDVNKCLEQLSQNKNGTGKPFIQRYEVIGERFIQIINWDKHQKPHNTEQASKIPPAPPLMEKGMEKGMGMGSMHPPVPQLSNRSLTVKQPLSIEEKAKDEAIYILYGEFKNVKLTEPDYQKLIMKFGEEKTKELIERLSTGIASKGYKYKNHYATILNWERKKEQEKPKTWRDLKYD